MPTAALKSLAKSHGISMGKAEHLWDKAKDIADKEYKFDEKNPKHWAIVMGIVKKMMGKRKVKESLTFKQFLESEEQKHLEDD